MKQSANLDVSFSGRLKDNDLIAVLRFLHEKTKTGILHLRRNDQEKSIYLKEGGIIFAISGYVDDRLGEILLKLGRITLDQYERSVEELKKGKKRQGAILVELGYMSPGDLIWAVKFQVKEAIVSTFTWVDGQYEFIEGDPPAGEVITLHMGVANLIFEGIKRVNDWTRLSNGLPLLDKPIRITTNPMDLFQDIDLEDRERAIIEKIDGKKSIRDIFRLSDLNAFETLKVLYFLIRLGMVEVIEEEGIDSQTEAGKGAVDAEVEPVDKELGLKRQKIIDEYNSQGGKDHYQILGLKRGASRDEAKKAYFQLAKEYHPDIHYQEGMGEMGEMLEAIFTRITEAYDVLSVDNTKKEYDLYSVISKHERRKPKEEKSNVRSLSQYKRGLEAFKKGDLKEALYSVEWAIRIEPTKPAYYTLLGKILSLIPGRVKDAENSFTKAMELEPSNSENYIGLGLLYKKGGMRLRAIKILEEVLVWDPENLDAKKELDALR